MNYLCILIINIWFLSSASTQETKICTGKYQVFDECGKYYCNPRCPLYRDKFLSPGLPCMPRKPPNCSPGCMCQNGYVNDTATGNCIKYEYCAQPGDLHTHFDHCGAACQRTCYCRWPRPGPTGLCRCPRCCEPGYVCNEGYVKNSTRWCVKPDTCNN